MLIQYNFVLLGGLVSEEKPIEEIGNAVMYLIIFLLAVNLYFIIAVVVKQLCRKC